MRDIVGAIGIPEVFRDLRLTVLERGWLSSNNVVLRQPGAGPAVVVDSGYDAHGTQTVALIEAAAGPAGVGLIVNTHLHSDHCGGNAHVQGRWKCRTWVPEVSIDAVRDWDASRLTFEQTGQTCRRFAADRGIAFGEALDLAGERWTALHAPGHDPDAMMLWHAGSRVLIAGDALWEARLAIIFPELEGRPGFSSVLEVLDCIEALSPAIVIPGHGAPFEDVAGALRRSRERVCQFAADPSRHFIYAARALVMFHMFEQRSRLRTELEEWLVTTPVFGNLIQYLGRGDPAAAAKATVDRLVSDNLLQEVDSGVLQIASTGQQN